MPPEKVQGPGHGPPPTVSGGGEPSKCTLPPPDDVPVKEKLAEPPPDPRDALAELLTDAEALGPLAVALPRTEAELLDELLVCVLVETVARWFELDLPPRLLLLAKAGPAATARQSAKMIAVFI